MLHLLKTLWRLRRSPNRAFVEFAPPGHYYSPLPDLETVRSRSARLFDREADGVGGVDLRVESQLALLAELGPLTRDLPFRHDPTPACRYSYNNSFFSYGDAVVLAAMMRHFRPARILEVGSGFSSASMLDVDETFLDSSTELTLVEPHPERLESLLRPGDLDRVRLLRAPIQEVATDEITRLGAGDFLFVDSSHVLKCGGDLNHLLFELLPVVGPGVLVHFHDVHWPFEYPRGWLDSGIAWNEAYALRAFLQYNAAFETLLFTSYLERRHRDRLVEAMPLALERPDDRTTPSNGSLWLRRAAAGVAVPSP